MKKAFVLSSGGLDSTVCLALAVEQYGKENVIALGVSYGQRHAKELDCARAVAQHYGVKRIELDLSCCFDGCTSSLMRTSTDEISIGTYHEQMCAGELKTVVPFRNGLFLAAAVCVALGRDENNDIVIYLGNHGGDVENNEYADCSKEFIDAMNFAIHLGTDGRASLFSPFAGMEKSELVKKGIELNVPFEMTWSCYNGKDRPCGKCTTCIQRAEAFSLNGAIDPLTAL